MLTTTVAAPAAKNTPQDAKRDTERKAARRARYSAQRLLWDITSLKRVAYCGRVVQESGRLVELMSGSVGGGGFSNLQTCGSVWACAVCAEKVAKVRRDEIKAALLAHLNNGGGIAFVTLTLSHKRSDPLAPLWDAIGPAWNRTTSGAGAQWNGNEKKGIRGDVREFGIEGYIRTVEVKHSTKTGFHPHVHATILTDAPLSDSQAARLLTRMHGRWSSDLAKSGIRASRAAQDIRIVRSASALADYITKTIEDTAGGPSIDVATVSVSGLAYELTGSTTKTLGSEHSRTPWQILHEIRTNGHGSKDYDPEVYYSNLDIWGEYEQASRGRRMHTWSRGLRARLLPQDPDEKTDEEEAQRNDWDDDAEALYAWDHETWTREKWYKHKAALLDAAEQGADAVRRAVKAIERRTIPSNPQPSEDEPATEGLNAGVPMHLQLLRSYGNPRPEVDLQALAGFTG